MSQSGKNTVYQQYVRNMLWRMCLDGVGEFNISEFALLADLKVTPNLRKQFKYAVQDNILEYLPPRFKPNDRRLYYKFTTWCLDAAGRS